VNVDLEEQARQDAEDEAQRDVPKLVKMAQQMRRASTAHQHKLPDIETTHPETGTTRNLRHTDHQDMDHAQPAAAEGPLDASGLEALAGDTRRRLPLVMGLLFAAVAGGAYLYSNGLPESAVATRSDTGSMSNADLSSTPVSKAPVQAPVAPQGTAVTEGASKDAAEIQPPVDPAQVQRQREAAEAEAHKAEEARLAAEIEARRQAEQARLTAELEAAKQAESARLQAEIEQQRQQEQARMRAELDAARQAERRRIQAELDAAKRAEQARIKAELDAARRAEQARLAAEAQATKQAEEAKKAKNAQTAVSNTPAPVDATPTPASSPKDEAKFNADPCAGPSAKFLSTCR